MAGSDPWNTLEEVKRLQMLKKQGLQVYGNSVSICRICCNEKTEQEILRIRSRRNGILILSEEPVQEQKDTGWLKKKKAKRKELVAAMCSEELFSVIDLNPEKLEILGDPEEGKWLEKAGRNSSCKPEADL